jgi:hypothetical protein
VLQVIPSRDLNRVDPPGEDEASRRVAVIVMLRVPVRVKVAGFLRTWGVGQQEPSQLPYMAL